MSAIAVILDDIPDSELGKIAELVPIADLDSPAKATTHTVDDDGYGKEEEHPHSDSEESPLQQNAITSETNNCVAWKVFSALSSLSETMHTTPACRRHSFYWTLSCCCPCLLQANITSKLERESPFTCFKYAFCESPIGSDIEFGPQGCKTCLSTTAMASCIWPCAAVLSIHSLWQRYKFKIFYPEDYRLRSANSYSSCCYYLMNWPENLLEQHQFVKDLFNEGQLTFKWDFNRYKDQLLPRPPEKTFIMMLFSAHTPAKMEFVRKFMMAVDRYTAYERHPAEDNSIGSGYGKRQNQKEEIKASFSPRMNNKNGADEPTGQNLSSGANDSSLSETNRAEGNEGDSTCKRNPLEGKDQIHSWIRNLSMRNSDYITFLEVWDIPTFKFNVYIVRNHTMNSDIALYIFDPSMADEEIDLIKKKYQENIGLFAAQHEKELMKLLNDDDDDQEDYESDHDEESAKKTASYLLVLNTHNPIFRKRGLDEGEYERRVNDIVSWVKKQGSPWDQILIEDEKDYHRFNKEILRILGGQ